MFFSDFDQKSWIKIFFFKNIFLLTSFFWKKTIYLWLYITESGFICIIEKNILPGKILIFWINSDKTWYTIVKSKLNRFYTKKQSIMNKFFGNVHTMILIKICKKHKGYLITLICIKKMQQNRISYAKFDFINNSDKTWRNRVKSKVSIFIQKNGT